MKKCSACQTEFSCSVNGSCWCAKYPPLLSPTTTTDCLCPDCLQNRMQIATEQYAQDVMDGKRQNDVPRFQTSQRDVQEGIDYYMENGFFVFKEWYHLKRGYCCGNRCRHCPFAHANVPV